MPRQVLADPVAMPSSIASPAASIPFPFFMDTRLVDGQVARAHQTPRQRRNVFYDTFTGGAGSITGHTAETGESWSLASGAINLSGSGTASGNSPSRAYTSDLVALMGGAIRAGRFLYTPAYLINAPEIMDMGDGNGVHYSCGGSPAINCRASSSISLDLTTTKDLHLQVRLRATDYTPSVTARAIGGQWDSSVTTAGQFALSLRSDGTLFFTWTDGTTVRTATSSVAISTVATDNVTDVWIDVRLVGDVGGGGTYTVDFAYAFDNTNDPSLVAAWTPLGITRFGVTIGNFAAGTRFMEVGSTDRAAAGTDNDVNNSTGVWWIGRIYRYVVRPGTNLTPVFDARFFEQLGGTRVFPDAVSLNPIYIERGQFQSYIGNNNQFSVMSAGIFGSAADGGICAAAGSGSGGAVSLIDPSNFVLGGQLVQITSATTLLGGGWGLKPQMIIDVWGHKVKVTYRSGPDGPPLNDAPLTLSATGAMSTGNKAVIRCTGTAGIFDAVGFEPMERGPRSHDWDNFSTGGGVNLNTTATDQQAATWVTAGAALTNTAAQQVDTAVNDTFALGTVPGPGTPLSVVTVWLAQLNSQAGCVIDYIDANNYLLAYYGSSSGNAFIAKVVAGVLTNLTTTAVGVTAAGTNIRMAVDYNWPTINYYFNGATAPSAQVNLTAGEQAVFLGTGRVGFMIRKNTGNTTPTARWWQCYSGI
jgi:hypothetical protein